MGKNAINFVVIYGYKLPFIQKFLFVWIWVWLLFTSGYSVNNKQLNSYHIKYNLLGETYNAVSVQFEPEPASAIMEVYTLKNSRLYLISTADSLNSNQFYIRFQNDSTNYFINQAHYAGITIINNQITPNLNYCIETGLIHKLKFSATDSMVQGNFTGQFELSQNKTTKIYGSFVFKISKIVYF